MNLLDLIRVNRDAIATNRGFYYQYLNVVITWLNNYINSEDIDIYTEVEDDIKEVGDKLIFTQVKCYSNSFSLKSVEIKKALVNFFAHYLEYKDNRNNLILKFITNSSLGKNQNILRKWISNQPPADEEIVKLCRIAVTEILNGEVEKRKNSILKKRKLTKESEKKLDDTFIDFQKLITNNDVIDGFTSKIRWEFKDLPPIEATEILLAEINNLLENSLFIKHPKKIILDAMLSDIYKRSQLPAIIDRKVNNSSLKILLDKTEEELSNFCDQRFVKLFDLRFDILENKINTIENVLNTTIKIQEKQGKVLKQIEEDNFSKQIIIPHSITKIPYIDQFTIIGRDKKVDDLDCLLLTNKNICVNGDGGMGKSSLLKIYVNKFKDEYDHIIWINVEAGLINSFILNDELAHSISLPPIDLNQVSDRFNIITSKLSQISGKNLLVVDAYGEDVPQINDLKSLHNWKIIIGTRLKMRDWKTLPIEALEFTSAKNLYYSFGEQQPVSDDLLKIFFNYVEYNTLVISLVSRTINYSFGLNLEKVLRYFQEQNLDNQNLQIALPEEYV